MTTVPAHSNRPTLFTQHFSTLDPRRTTKGNFLHLLTDILFLVKSAVISGADDWETVILFGENQQQWLKKYGTYIALMPK